MFKKELPNPYLKTLDSDFLYHLGLSTENDLKKMFHDVKFVCTGGSTERMKEFAHFIKEKIGYTLPVGAELTDLGAAAHRYAFYKIGPVISVSHGMGFGSLSILLHEMIKLVRYAECDDPIFIRIGTCGGVGVKPGTVIVSNAAMNGMLRNVHEFIILGKRIERPAILDQNLAKEIQSCHSRNDKFDVILGTTIGTDDFYEGQGRIDGAICEHTEKQKEEFLNKIHGLGVRNFEMECPVFAAITHMTNIRSAIVCSAIVNRLKGDQVQSSGEERHEWTLRAQELVGDYIKKVLKM